MTPVFEFNLRATKADGQNIRSERKPKNLFSMRQHVGVNRIHGGERIPGNIGIRDGDAEVFFKRDDEFQSVYGVEAESFRAKQGHVVLNLFFRGFEHQVLNHHGFDAVS